MLPDHAKLAVPAQAQREAARARCGGRLTRRVGRVAGSLGSAAGRQNHVATLAGSRVAKKITGSLFESKNRHSHHNIGLEPSQSLASR